MSAEEPADVARLREALASLRSHDTEKPVDAERIFDAVHGDMSAEERQAVVEEILINPAAAEAWRLARELTPDTAADGAASPAVPATARATWKWMSIAAAAVLATGLGWQWFELRGTEEPVYRSVESITIAAALPAGADVSRAAPVLRWTALNGARYRVRVLTADLQLLEESDEIATPEYTLSEPTLARIPPGGQIRWQVDARIPGEAIVTSPTFSNRVP